MLGAGQDCTMLYSNNFIKELNLRLIPPMGQWPVPFVKV